MKTPSGSVHEMDDAPLSVARVFVSVPSATATDSVCRLPSNRVATNSTVPGEVARKSTALSVMPLPFSSVSVSVSVDSPVPSADGADDVSTAKPPSVVIR
ncbi:MAG: hypothetical protein CMJ18_25440 [Phycisphaeraceae bacterium]|nr:hypothetical protein [Phycisphaeraceae bacterium]